MTLSPVVQTYHVEEAIRLFKFSTMDAVSAGSVDGLSRGELNQEVNRIEKEIRRRLPVGWSTSYQSLVREFVTQQGYSSHSLERTLFMMEKREIIRFSGQVSNRITSYRHLLRLTEFVEQKKVVHRLVSLSLVKPCMLYADSSKEWVFDCLIVYLCVLVVFPVVLSRELRIINDTGFSLVASIPTNITRLLP